MASDEKTILFGLENGTGWALCITIVIVALILRGCPMSPCEQCGHVPGAKLEASDDN